MSIHETRMERVKEFTLEQAKVANEILDEMGIGGRHPDREALRVHVMQTLATNYQSIVIGATAK